MAKVLATLAAADYLGVSVDRVRHLAATGELPYILIRGERRFEVDSLDKYRSTHPRRGARKIRYLTAASDGICAWCVDPITTGSAVALLTDGETYVHDRHLTGETAS